MPHSHPHSHSISRFLARALAELACACVLLAAPAPSLHAQSERGPSIEIQLPSGSTPMMVRLQSAIDGGRFEELLSNGFDVRLHLRGELWKAGRILDDVVSQTEWDVIVHYDQFDQTFDVARIASDGTVTPLGNYRRLADAKAALALPHSPPLASPQQGRRHYYSVRADIETLDLRDLDEVTRWLRGELAPAVKGRRNPGTALGRGLRTLMSRLLGGEVRRLEARSPRFVVGPETPEGTASVNRAGSAEGAEGYASMAFTRRSVSSP